MSDPNLPSFRKPPVIETVLGVQFEPIRGFSNAHLGAFWKYLLAQKKGGGNIDWSLLADASPIKPSFERFGLEMWLPPGLMVEVGSPPTGRLQIRNERLNAMIQVQNTRFHYNWIGRRDVDYKRYSTIRPWFDEAYECFRAFLVAEGLDEPNENQWEVTYVNQIPRGTWQSPSDWSDLFQGLLGPCRGPDDVQIESIGGSWHFEISPQRGRLHIDVKHAGVKAPDAGEVIRLTLTARGPIGDSNAECRSLGEGLDLGRRVIVLTFKEVTSPTAHKIWELVQ